MHKNNQNSFIQSNKNRCDNDMDVKIYIKVPFFYVVLSIDENTKSYSENKLKREKWLVLSGNILKNTLDKQHV